VRELEQSKERITSMATVNLTDTELEELIKKAVVSTLSERSDLLERAVSEAILDMKLGLAIQEGDNGDYVEEKEVLMFLKE